jgi:hypothetical protein
MPDVEGAWLKAQVRAGTQVRDRNDPSASPGSEERLRNGNPGVEIGISHSIEPAKNIERTRTPYPQGERRKCRIGD